MRLHLLPAFGVLAFTIQSAPAYTYTGSHWYSAPITMQLQLGSSSGTLSDGSTSWGASAEDALNTWNSNIGSERFSVVRDSFAQIAEGNGLNNVFFSGTVYGQAWGTGVLAVTLTFSSSATQTSECDVLFNNTLQWDSYRGAQRYNSSGTVFDFHRVAMHEFGHVLGLDHPDQAGQTVVAIMNSRISDLDTLAADDIAGAQSLYGASTSTPAPTAPQITTQPVSQSVTAGSTVTFSVAVSSATTVAYQWWKDNVAVGGATGATLTLTSVSSSAAGNYWCVVTNSAGSTTSSAATLVVNTPPPPPPPVYAPTITSQPVSVTVGTGNAASFTVTASGSGPLSFSWRKNNLTIAGANASTYTISSAQPSDAGTYVVVVSNSGGSVTSGNATLAVTAGPTITAQPAGQTVNQGGTFTLSVTATGTPAPTYQWFRNGTAISGATTATYSVASAVTSDAGSYTVRVANSSGSVTSTAVSVSINILPAITTAPVTQTLSAGDRLSLAAAAIGSPAPTYQWQKNGSNIAGATNATFVITAAAGTDSGTYDVVVTNAAGSVTTVPVLVTVNWSQLVNLSTRGFVPAGGALTAGFVLRGSTDKPILVRGVGPALNSFGVTNALATPQVSVISQNTAQTLAANSSWSETPQLSSAFQSVGAFPLQTGSADSASEIRLLPGAYTTQVKSGTAGSGGIALAEVYDADAASQRSRLVNLSTLGYAGSGDNALVAGFSIQGNASKRVLIRAIGPSLVTYGVSNRIANPRLDVYPLGQSSPIAGNDDWSGSADLQAAFTAAGAFPLNTGTQDAAVVLSLAPGGYTVVVSGVGGTTGYALVEIYDLDP